MGTELCSPNVPRSSYTCITPSVVSSIINFDCFFIVRKARKDPWKLDDTMLGNAHTLGSSRPRTAGRRLVGTAYRPRPGSPPAARLRYPADAAGSNPPAQRIMSDLWVESAKLYIFVLQNACHSDAEVYANTWETPSAARDSAACASTDSALRVPEMCIDGWIFVETVRRLERPVAARAAPIRCSPSGWYALACNAQRQQPQQTAPTSGRNDVGSLRAAVLVLLRPEADRCTGCGGGGSQWRAPC